MTFSFKALLMTTYWQKIYIRHQLGVYVVPSTNFIQEKIGKLSVVYTHVFQEAMYRPPTAIRWFGQATINLINHPNSGQTGLVSFNELLKYCGEFSY